jgi:hypothetical protein
VIVRRDRIDVEVRRDADGDELGPAGKFSIPFASTTAPQKGITRNLANDGHIHPVARENLLNAIRRASRWVEAVRSGEAESFDEIAAQEGVGVRHVRRLVPLAFLYPKVLNEIADCVAPAELTVSMLTEALPHSWVDQYASFGSSGS